MQTAVASSLTPSPTDQGAVQALAEAREAVAELTAALEADRERAAAPRLPSARRACAVLALAAVQAVAVGVLALA